MLNPMNMSGWKSHGVLDPVKLSPRNHEIQSGSESGVLNIAKLVTFYSLLVANFKVNKK